MNSKPKILLVDDVDFFLELEKDFLSRTPATLLTAKNGQQALELVRRERPQLVFMDVNMPVMDGLTCCKLIKADPQLRSTPVVMVFATSTEIDNQACLEAGSDGVLNKPVDRAAFLDLGRKFLFAVERREPRIPCQMTITFKIDGQEQQAMALDISTGGIYIQHRKEIALDLRLSLSFLLPMVSPNPIEVRARVAWVNQGFPRRDLSIPQGFGVQFLHPPAAALETIKRYLEQHAPPSAGKVSG